MFVEKHRSICSISFKDVFKILIFFNWSDKIIAPELGDYVNKNK